VNQTVALSLSQSPHPGLRHSLRSYGVVTVFVVLCVVFAASSEFFLTWPNWSNILRQSSINGILAVGMCFVVLTKGIDLSVGSVMALAGAVAASLTPMAEPHALPLVIAAGLGVGLLLGTANGLLVAKMHVPSFVVTLGMLSIARGLTLIFTDGQPIPNLSPEFRAIGNSTLAGLPMPVWILLGVFVVATLVLKFTPLGRYVYAVGGNEKAARTAGIAVDRIKVLAYVVCGGLAGLAGMVLAARTSAALPQAGAGYELDAIAAVVIGGASLSGGRGSMLGTLFGALIIGTINNGLDLLGISSYYQQLFKGLIIVAAVMLDFSRPKS
jgi:putative xylitol transport system permease protein